MRKRLFNPLWRRSPGRHRGSALLIVLGFLSFMVISAVSFAIYMRTERQASSNYRHAVNARHMLNIALARAMEEVDSEMRRTANTNLKFPDWPGRVLVSAIPDTDNDVQKKNDARVLSMEALSFLPPFLVNDVRRYAYRQEQDGDDPYKGAKWRQFSSAREDIGLTIDDASGAVNGRYAYVCVNVSDMLNVNACRALTRDTSMNRVSLGHLFDNDTQRENFDNRATADGHYFSLQDFYAARYEYDQSDLSSPFRNYVGNGNFAPFENPELLKQVFITDSIVKPEPADKDACNIWLNPPISPLLLNIRLLHDLSALRVEKKFWDAFTHSDLFPGADQAIMAALLKDYIDTDNVPTLLNAPCLEMVPMISQVTIPKDIMQYSVSSRIEGGAAGQPSVTVYTLHLLDDSTLQFPVEVEVVWPFKHAQHRRLAASYLPPSYSLDIEAFLVVDKNGNERSTTGFTVPGEWIPLTIAGAPSPFPTLWENTIVNENDCFGKISAVLQANASEVTFDVIKDGEFLNGFSANFRVFLCMFVRIKEGNDWVDSVPHLLPINPVKTQQEKAVTPKLYYQTVQIPLAPGEVVPTPYVWEWRNLEVADPRFNHNASNWVKNDAEELGAPPGVNASTTAILGLEGRDADIFMFVANTGELQSPGELGFIIRPHFFQSARDPSRKFNDASATEPAEKGNMFRTIRLYDHGGIGATEKRDEIYKHFYAMRPDGTLPGVRVNPLSDMPEVLEAAIWDTPLDYWIASTNNGLTTTQRKILTFTRDSNYFGTTSPSDSGWQTFRDKWTDDLEKVVQLVDNPNAVWSRTLSDFYGNQMHFKWYDAAIDRKTIFGITVPRALHEVDRKMLYSFSLDSFSDRQQLFLYFVRAEVTMPSFGGGSEMLSLAGGRAVALVWRDPYPRGFKKDNDVNNNNDTMDSNNDWYPDNRNTDFESPWKRYGSVGTARHASHHDTRVLFFKQLGQ